MKDIAGLVDQLYFYKKILYNYYRKMKKEVIIMNEKEIIEIVKHGDVSDDVCEWKLEDDNLMTGCGDYFNLYDNCTGKFKYCPRCGKKIKVVE